MSRSTVTILRPLVDTNISETSKKPAQSLLVCQAPSLRPQSNRDTSNVAAEFLSRHGFSVSSRGRPAVLARQLGVSVRPFPALLVLLPPCRRWHSHRKAVNPMKMRKLFCKNPLPTC
jgi:hypothetical protein